MHHQFLRSPSNGPAWWVRWASWSCVVGLISAAGTAIFTAPGWWKAPLHYRTDVSESAARTVLYETIGRVLVQGTTDLCKQLGTDPASSCATSLERVPTPPGRSPGIQCVTQLIDGPFAGATVLTLRGRDDLGEPYTTDFVVLDRGYGPQPLDPVYWSGLHIVETAGNGPTSQVKTTTWRYAGESTRCN
ncbi:hypothetical protein [Stomatohabitans albus]|uniref:hypothetical protein n=1 Tax=Stomatohabitans albus TaxID=3110766 RepID=UPI00300D7A78